MRFHLALLLFTLSVAVGQGASPVPGQLLLDPDNPHWLQRQGGGSVFLCGPGDPENFLYRGERQPDGTRRGDQVELIEKLARHGGNTIYMEAVRTHGGDAKGDRTQNPFVDSDPAKGVDARILEQWEDWFARMDRHDIVVYFLFYDDSARVWATGDKVGDAERAFVETIVRRFKHHRNLIWIVGEEVDERYSPPRVRALAEVIRAADEHGHIIGAHHLAGTTFRAWSSNSALRQFSMQLNLKDEAAHGGAIEARTKAAGRYQVVYAENTATPADFAAMRRFTWDVAMGGLMPLVLQMDIAGTPVEALAQCRTLQRFFESTDARLLEPHDELRLGATKYVLAAPGKSYVAYAREGGDLGLRDLPGGRCEITWVDAISGRTATRQEQRTKTGDGTFARPAGFGAEAAAWIRFPDAGPVTPSRPVQIAADAKSAANLPPRVKPERFGGRAGGSIYVQLRFEDEDGPGPYRYTIIEPPRHGRLSGTDNDRTYTPAAGFTGTDGFTWKVSDGTAESEPVTVTLEVRRP